MVANSGITDIRHEKKKDMELGYSKSGTKMLFEIEVYVSAIQKILQQRDRKLLKKDSGKLYRNVVWKSSKEM